ncbi:MAG: histidine kinase [Verrucomicrobia bacterium]|nr:histidine kinase [Verrucomicrobiota bacterium]
MNGYTKENDPRSTPGAGGDDHFERQKREWQTQPFLSQVLNAVPEIILVLNSSRQIIFANETLLSRFKIHDGGDPGGQRFGDVLECRHSREEGGCGAARLCRICGGLQAIEAGLRGNRGVQECRMLTRSGDALDLQVTAVPLDLGANRYVICTFADIGALKRRRALERLFFHDVMNTAAGVSGLANLLVEAEGEQAAEVRVMIVNTAAALVEQIQSQRLLTMAENGDLTVSIKSIDSLVLLRGILAKWRDEGKTRRLNLVIKPDSVPVPFSSDEAIVSHVLNSMVRNAFEASSRGMEIALDCHAEEQAVVFRVRNSTVMTEDAQLQVFQRSFSTRGSGRGLGTYSMKLLTERLLGGKVGFSSGGIDGTVFYLRLPLIPPPP